MVHDAAPIGVFLHDSLHTPTHLTFELETISPRLAPGAVVLADNTSWTGQAFDRFARSLGVPVVRHGRSDLVGLRFPTEVAGQWSTTYRAIASDAVSPGDSNPDQVDHAGAGRLLEDLEFAERFARPRRDGLGAHARRGGREVVLGDPGDVRRSEIGEVRERRDGERRRATGESW